MDICFFLAYCERRKLGVTSQFMLIDIYHADNYLTYRTFMEKD